VSETSTPHHYAIALGSNRRHRRHGAPRRVIAAAFDVLAADDNVRLMANSGTISSLPVGPSQRQYANAAAVIETVLRPDALLELLKRIERDFGRRGGRRWGARVLDLDIILWSGGLWHAPTLTIPHAHWQERRFVADPLCEITPQWRVPRSGSSVRHIAHRLRRHQPVDPVPRNA
jgi:2-amino-4-hydroxy-6-hydroxymethyldihydropteridine diphosphokinase